MKIYELMEKLHKCDQYAEVELSFYGESGDNLKKRIADVIEYEDDGIVDVLSGSLDAAIICSNRKSHDARSHTIFFNHSDKNYYAVPANNPGLRANVSCEFHKFLDGIWRADGGRK